ncbi:MAG: ABC transporter permease [Phycisphaerae bacterium]|jgi:predicted permease
MSALLQDLRYAARTLWRSPGFALVVILTLSLGIGASTAIFSVVHGVLLRPLPFADADHLVVLWSRLPGLNGEGLVLGDLFNDEDGVFSPAMYFEIKDQSRVFDDVAILHTHSFTLTEGGVPERVRGMRASAWCLATLGAKPALGRVFSPADDDPGRPHTIVLSHALWQRRFGCDPGVIGTLLELDGQSYGVIGVLAEDFPATRAYLPMFRDPAARIDYWIPLSLSAADRYEHGRQNYRLFARLAYGVTLADARAELRLLVGRMVQQHPDFYPTQAGFTVDVLPMDDLVVRAVRPALWSFSGAVALVLLIACANIANLLLARATKRRKEIGMRLALGASRLRIMRQLLTEAILLSVLGGGGGLLLGSWGTSLLLAIGAEKIPRINEVGVSVSVVTFTLGLSVLTGIIFGLVPAWTASRMGLEQTLREGPRSAVGAGSFWHWRSDARHLLVVGELSLSVILLIGAGLLIHSFCRLQSVDPGFAPDNVLTFQLPPNPDYGRDMARHAAFFDEVGQRIAALPGVESVGGVNVLPMTPGDCTGPVAVEGQLPADEDTCTTADERVVLRDYFETMKIPLIAGRFFNEYDTSDSLPVVIVDETFARRFWPSETAIGRRIKAPWPGSQLSWLTVVGVVGAVRQSDLDSLPTMTYYRPYPQWAQRGMYLTVCTSTDPEALVNAVAKEVWSLDKDRPLMQVATMEQRLSDILSQRRFSLALLVVFAGIALVLAVVGLYAVLAHIVSQSTHEIGVRMALGARRADVLRAVLGRGLMLAGVGLAIGLAVSLAATRLLASFLYGVEVTDATTFVGVAGLLAVVAVLACYLPARRATRVDPMVALRCE